MELFDVKEQSVIGVDLGQSKDYTAISILEQWQKYWPAPFQGKREGDPFYHVTFLERIALGTSYPDIIKRVQQVYSKVTEQNGRYPTLVIDATGVGKPVYDEFKESGFNPVGIMIHGGDSITRDGNIFHVPKRDLAGVLQILYQQGRIKVSKQLPTAKVLNKELLNFKVKINLKTGHDSYEAWRENVHDDLVLSVACAAWYFERSRGKGITGPVTLPELMQY